VQTKREGSAHLWSLNHRAHLPAAQLKHRFGFDDALDAFGIHAPGGILGGILTGLFATEAATGEGSGVRGAFYGDDGTQLLMQLYGIGVSVAWASVVSFLLLKLVDVTMGLRVASEEELLGLDMVPSPQPPPRPRPALPRPPPPRAVHTARHGPFLTSTRHS